jgi:sulfite exporter TauE/SafE
VPVAAGATLGALALTGLLGGLGHCAGMCGPLVALAGIKLRERAAAPDPGGAARARLGRAPLSVVGSTLIYHGARVGVYTGLGAIVGAASGITALAAAISLVLGAAVITLGLGYVGLLPPIFRQGGVHWWDSAASWALRRPGGSGAALLGALNGLLPCGLVYGALLVSAGTGSAAGGALCMLVFGLATLPALVVIQTGAGAFLGPGRRVWLVRAAGVIVLLIGVQLLLRGFAALGVMPSVYLGGFMLW